jgi:hypothetical protein
MQLGKIMSEGPVDQKNKGSKENTREGTLFFRFHYGENFCRVDPTKPCWREELTGRPVTPPLKVIPESSAEGKDSAE